MVPEHDRYLIYAVLGKRVTVRLPRGGLRRIASGVVDYVYRNVFDHQIEMRLGGRLHVFPEPKAIVPSGETGMLFLYGAEGEMNDEAFFRELRASSHTESVYDVMRRTESSPRTVTRFSAHEKYRLRRGKVWQEAAAIA